MIKYLTLITLCASSYLWGLDFSVGSGLHSVYAGRAVPIIYAGLIGENVAITGHSSGVESTLAYQSTFQGNFFIRKIFGKLLWGNLSGGAGVGMVYSSRGFRIRPEHFATRERDYNGGPVIRASWNLFFPVYLTIEAFFGIKSYNPLINSWQHSTVAVMEIRI